jgi:hypothetical protein
MSVLSKAVKYLSNTGSNAYRVCKLLKDGDFNDVLSSQELIQLLNDGPGKKIKIFNLSAIMEPLLLDEIIKVKNVSEGKATRKYWFPGWITKDQVTQKLGGSTYSEGVMFFSGKDSWSDVNKNFPKMISSLKGDLCIVDPFYGNGTFFVLEKFGKSRSIKFLTSQMGSEEQKDPTKFDINLKRFKREFKNIQLKRYDKPYELHDRYIIAENALVIVGHGIKDMAGKESFIILLPAKLIKTFLPTLKKTFEERWKKSNNL